MRTKLIKRLNERHKRDMKNVVPKDYGYDDDIYFLGYEDDRLVALLAFIEGEDKMYAQVYSLCEDYSKLLKRAEKVFENFKYDYSELLMRAYYKDVMYETDKAFTINVTDKKITLFNKDEEIGELSVYVGENVVSIYDVIIYDQYRSKGYGKCLMKMVHNYIFSELKKDIILHVTSNNIPAVKLYETMGYELIEELKIYSSDIA